MKIHFYKYQGTGNDFVIIDNRNNQFPKANHKLIQQLCDRKFGIGADGLILLENSSINDFKMVYFNADGNLGSMCGNGGRCIVAFAKRLNMIKNKTEFEALDKIYYASFDKQVISLKMTDVNQIEVYDDHLFLDTGSPHDVRFISQVSDFDVYSNGQKIRYGSPYFENGTNVNFVEKINKNTFKVRTYERGVENETLSCGTGVAAVALASYSSKKTKDKSINIQTQGGNLNVSFEEVNGKFKNIVLKGPANFIFSGEIDI